MPPEYCDHRMADTKERPMIVVDKQVDFEGIVSAV